MPIDELAVLESLSACTHHEAARLLLVAAGWTPCGAGDWAIALRSPSGSHAARISPFDPTAHYCAELYRRAATTGQVPRLDAEHRLEGGGSMLVMEFLEEVPPAEAVAFHRQISAREPAVAELATILETVHREALQELPWCGPIDDNPQNVMRGSDGRLVVADVFYADGPDLYATVLSDPRRVACSMPPSRRRYMFDLPLASSGGWDPALRTAMREALRLADTSPD